MQKIDQSITAEHVSGGERKNPPCSRDQLLGTVLSDGICAHRKVKLLGDI